MEEVGFEPFAADIQPTSTAAQGRSQWYLFNARGDVIALTDAAGVVVREYRYDAFGNEVDPCPYDTNPWRFNAEYFDRETGLYYLRMRFFNPRTGRFLNPDPLFWGNNSPDLNVYTMRQTVNLYAFVMNNPIRFIDPWGLSARASWIFYDPHDTPPPGYGGAFVTREKAELIRDDLMAFHGEGHIVYLVSVAPVFDSHGNEIMSATDYFIHRFNNIGNNGAEISTVVFYFHMDSDRLRVNSGKKDSHSADRFFVREMYRITNTRPIETLVLLGCFAARGNNNIAYQFSNHLNADRVIGATGAVVTQTETDRSGFLWLNSTRRTSVYIRGPGNFIVYSRGDGRLLGQTNFRNLSNLIRTASR